MAILHMIMSQFQVEYKAYLNEWIGNGTSSDHGLSIAAAEYTARA